MNDRIVLRKVGLVLTPDQMVQVSGGTDGGDDSDIGGGLTGGQETQKVSSQDPNGPMDKDKSKGDY
jgi:hypothetical protein